VIRSVCVMWCWAVTEFSDTGLLPFTWYEYRVLSDNGFGAALSPAVVYRTSAGVPSGNFTITVELVETRSLSVSWTAPTSPNGLIERYVLTSLDDSDRTTTHYEGSALGSRVLGLSAYSRYVLTVSACTSAGCVDTSLTAVTLQAPPEGQSPPHITAHGPTVLTVAWQPPSQPNGNLSNTG